MKLKIRDLMQMMDEKSASDLFFRAGGPAHMRIDGKVAEVEGSAVSVEDMQQAVVDITTEKQRDTFAKSLDIDFALYIEGLGRFRVSIFIQRNTPSLVIRRVQSKILSFEELNLPAKILQQLSLESRGLVLLTGTMGSGKSTTIASMVEYINCNLNKHVLTIEEPIEFTYKDKMSIINQREIGLDVLNYPTALRALTLQSPDVIYIGNIRDSETMNAALTAADTGTLVLSTLHTVNAPQTVERIIGFFPPHQHNQIRIQLSILLKGVISLRLIPRKDSAGRIPAYESMILSPTISRLIREDKVWEIPRYIEEGEIFGMQSFNQSLVRLVRQNKIDAVVAEDFADNKDEFHLALKGIKKT